jgi:hypothetical protein
MNNQINKDFEAWYVEQHDGAFLPCTQNTHKEYIQPEVISAHVAFVAGAEFKSQRFSKILIDALNAVDEVFSEHEEEPEHVEERCRFCIQKILELYGSSAVFSANSSDAASKLMSQYADQIEDWTALSLIPITEEQGAEQLIIGLVQYCENQSKD